MAEISPRHPGRPSLGARTQLKIRVFDDIRAASRQRAKFYGLTETDYIAALIAADAGLEGRAPQLGQALDFDGENLQEVLDYSDHDGDALAASA